MRGQERHLSLIRGFYVNTTAILETGAWLAPEPQRCSQPCELRPQHSCSGDGVSPRGPNFFLPQPGGSGMKSGPRDTDPGQSLDVERTSLGGGGHSKGVWETGRQRGISLASGISLVETKGPGWKKQLRNTGGSPPPFSVSEFQGPTEASRWGSEVGCLGKG